MGKDLLFVSSIKCRNCGQNIPATPKNVTKRDSSQVRKISKIKDDEYRVHCPHCGERFLITLPN